MTPSDASDASDASDHSDPSGVDFTSAPPPKRVDRWAHRRGEPRVFAVFWIGFMMAASIVTIGALGLVGLIAPDVYRPGARAMIAAAALGIAVGWPMTRLSQMIPSRPVAAVTADLIVLLAPLHALLWPQCWRWMAAWPWQAVGTLSVLITGWAMFVGALLVGAMRDLRRFEGEKVAGGRRAAWMAVVVIAAAAGPIAGVFAARAGGVPHSHGDANVWLLTSPVTAVFEITRDRFWSSTTAAAQPAHYGAAAVVCAVALLAWGIVSLAGGTRRPRDSQHPASNLSK